MGELSEVILFDLAVAFLFFVVPATGEARIPVRERRLGAEWNLLTPAEKTLALLDDQRVWGYRRGSSLTRVALPGGVTLSHVVDLMRRDRAFRDSWGFFTFGDLRSILRREGEAGLERRLETYPDNVIVGLTHTDDLGRPAPHLEEALRVGDLVSRARLSGRVPGGVGRSPRFHFLHSTGWVHTGRLPHPFNTLANPFALMAERRQVTIRLSGAFRSSVEATDQLTVPYGSEGWIPTSASPSRFSLPPLSVSGNPDTGERMDNRGG